MELVETKQLPVYDHRGGRGPTLVFLHYWGGTARTWRPVVDRLEDRAAIAIDFRGWGRSRALPGPRSLAQLAADTLAVIDHAGIDDYVLVGHSMGGKVAQLVAAGRPSGLTGLVLVGSGPAKPPAAVTDEYRRGLSHAYDSVEAIEASRDGVLTATALRPELAAQVLEDSGSGDDDARAEWPLRGIAEDITQQTSRIRVPTLVVAGENDVVEPVAVLRENLLPYLASAHLEVIGGSGHLLPLEAADELAHAIEAFVPTL